MKMCIYSYVYIITSHIHVCTYIYIQVEAVLRQRSSTRTSWRVMAAWVNATVQHQMAACAGMSSMFTRRVSLLSYVLTIICTYYCMYLLSYVLTIICTYYHMYLLLYVLDTMVQHQMAACASIIMSICTSTFA